MWAAGKERVRINTQPSLRKSTQRLPLSPRLHGRPPSEGPIEHASERAPAIAILIPRCIPAPSGEWK